MLKLCVVHWNRLSISISVALAGVKANPKPTHVGFDPSRFFLWPLSLSYTIHATIINLKFSPLS